MHRETLTLDALPAWIKLNGVKLNDVQISNLHNNKGLGLVSSTDLTEEDAILMSIPPELLLSLENVWNYAKADRHLLEVLEAAREYAEVKVLQGLIINTHADKR